MNYLKIGQYLANKRKSKNLTQKELASLLNVTDKAVSKWETGSNLPDISMFVKLAAVLETTIDELIAGEDKKSQEKKSGSITITKKMKRKITRHFIIAEYTKKLMLILESSILCFFTGIAIYELNGFVDGFYYNASKYARITGLFFIVLSVCGFVGILLFYSIKLFSFNETSYYSWNNEGFWIKDKKISWDSITKVVVDHQFCILIMSHHPTVVDYQDFQSMRNDIYQCISTRKNVQNGIRAICKACLYDFWILILLLEGGYHFCLKKYGFEFIYPQVELCLIIMFVLLSISLLFIWRNKFNKRIGRMINFGYIAGLILVCLIGFVNPIKTYVSFSSNFSSMLILKHNENTNKIIEYRYPYLIFAKASDCFDAKGIYSTRWVTNDCNVVEYIKMDGGKGTYLATFGDRGSGYKYYYVTSALQGTWKTKNNHDRSYKIDVNPENILIQNEYGEKEYSYSTVQQFGTIAITLSSYEQVDYVIVLNENCDLLENGLTNSEGTITLISLDKGEMNFTEMFCTTYKEDGPMNDFANDLKNKETENNLKKMRELVSSNQKRNELIESSEMYLVKTPKSDDETIMNLVLEKFLKLNDWQEVKLNNAYAEIKAGIKEDFYAEIGVSGYSYINDEKYEQTHRFRIMKYEDGYVVHHLSGTEIANLGLVDYEKTIQLNLHIPNEYLLEKDSEQIIRYMSKEKINAKGYSFSTFMDIKKDFSTLKLGIYNNDRNSNDSETSGKLEKRKNDHCFNIIQKYDPNGQYAIYVKADTIYLYNQSLSDDEIENDVLNHQASKAEEILYKE